MKRKKGVLTNETMEELYRILCESKKNQDHDANGRPIYTLSFHGTQEEYEALKKKLLTLDPEQP